MIIGLDLSLTHTGWVILYKGRVKAYGTIVPKKIREVRRLAYIRKEIRRIIKLYKPTNAGIEGYAMGINRGGRTFSIGELGGVIKVLLYRMGVDYVVVAPKTLKKFAADNGNANKYQMANAVMRKWRESFKTEHEVDAYALARITKYIFWSDWKITATGKEYEAIKTVVDDVSGQNYIRRLI